MPFRSFVYFQTVVCIIGEELLDHISIFQKYLCQHCSRTIAGTQPNYFRRSAMFQLYQRKILVQGNNCINAFPAGVHKYLIIAMVCQAQESNMGRVRKRIAKPVQQPKGNILIK